MTDDGFLLAILGLTLVVLSPALPLAFPRVSRKWVGRGFVTGFIIIGVALRILLLPETQQTEP
jgi:hypothetical protein